MAMSETAFLDALYRGVTDDNALSTALRVIQEMFGCTSGAFVSLDARLPNVSVAVASGVLLENLPEYHRDFAGIDPGPPTFAGLPPGSVSTTDRLMSPEMIARDPFRNEFFEKLGLVETIGGTLFSGSARFALIGLQRSDDRPQFDDGEIADLERLMPHLTRALQLRRAFHNVRSENAALIQMVDRLSAGVVVLDAAGHAAFSNAAMVAIAGRNDGLSLDRLGRPFPAHVGPRKRLQELINDATHGGAGGMITIPRSNQRQPYAVLVTPLPVPPDGVDALRPAGGAMVLVHDPDIEAKSDIELLERGLNLPKGAARLVAALTRDSDLKSFAEEERITIHTARFHVRTALARTGARTQAELVRLAVRLLKDLGTRRDKQ